MYIFNLYCFCVVLQSFGADCTLEEEGLGEEEDEIDQFNDDTFGAGANGTVLFLLYLNLDLYTSIYPTKPTGSYLWPWTTKPVIKLLFIYWDLYVILYSYS